MYTWTSSGVVAKARKPSMASGLTALVGLLLLCGSAWGQSKGDISNRPPMPPPRPSSSIGGPADPLGFPSTRPNSPAVPPSSVVEMKSSIIELKENVRLLEIINQELQGAVSSPSGPDYETVVTDATDISKLAIRLMRNLALPRGEAKATPGAPTSTMSVEELRASIAALDSTVQKFLNDSVVMQARTVDAGQLTNVGSNLESMARLSSIVRKEAEDLAIVSASTKRAKSSAHIKSRLKPSTSIQLTLECGAWSIGDLLKRTSQIKGRGWVNVGVEAQTRRHQLNEQAILSIDDCVDGATYEKGIADKVQYVAIVRDFTSYEVKGRVFAYRVPYQIGFTKGGQLAERYSQTVSFYYVDEAGDGEFELLTGPVAFGLVPDWARELGQKH